MNYYNRLAAEGDVDTLAYLSQWDERVYDVLDRHALFSKVADRIPDPIATTCLSRGAVYPNVVKAVLPHFVRACSLLQRHTTAKEGVVLAEFVGSFGLFESNRLKMFAYSETLRHMVLSHSSFVERGALHLLALMFSDDFLEDAVSKLQYKTDVLNHVNRIFVETQDFNSWRLSVRVLSLAGGCNEDRMDVDDTIKWIWIITRIVPEFFEFFTVATVYGLFRHYPLRVRGIVPRWLRRHRALFTGVVCGCLGVWANSALEFRIYRERLRYEIRCSQELRRREAATRHHRPYDPNPFFDNLEGITRRIFTMQMKTYAVVAGVVGMSLMPLTRVPFPAWMGDVPFRHPFVPRFFPSLVGLAAASRCAVPFVVAPLAIVGALRAGGCGASLADRLTHLRSQRWEKTHAS